MFSFNQLYTSKCSFACVQDNQGATVVPNLLPLTQETSNRKIIYLKLILMYGGASLELIMPNQKFTDKIGSQEATFKLTPKEYTSEEAYLKDHSDTFKEFLNFYEKNFTKADALRLLNRVEREIGDITAIADPENNRGKVSHVKADFMHAYVMEHLPFGYVGKTFEQKIGAKLYESDLLEALQDKFDLGDKYSNHGLGVTYKGKNAGELPEHVDIRDALDDHIWKPSIDAGKKLLQDFINSKNKVIG